MKKQIMIVDDERTIRESLFFFLTEEGYECCMADNGLTAMRKLATREFDLIITDLKMPRKDGIALIEHINESYADLDVLIITAYSNHNLAEIGVNKGATDFLHKPLDFDEMLTKVKGLVETE